MKKITALLMAMMLLCLPAAFAVELPEGVPTTLAAPTISNMELLKNEDGVPYFRMEITVPSSIIELDEARPTDGWVDVEMEGTYGEGENQEPLADGGGLSVWVNEENAVPGKANTYYATFDLIDEGGMTETDIKAKSYSFRYRFSYTYYYGEGPGEWDYVYSPWSNELANKSESFYKDASSWAIPELDKAKEAGLIPAILVGADMTKPISREEFAELALVLYEKTTETSVQPAASNPFTDTSNPQILKALNIGVTQGTSSTTFSPKVLINREQCATMLFRTIKAIAPDGDYTVEGIKNFPDQSNISEYAVLPTKYMSKLGIIKGDASTGNFMPKATTTVQEASGYGMATREAAVLMSVRTYETMK
ncbi:MAG: hypothetical protein AAGU76_10940 [Sedimentibacter sp.]|uniref:hypothetical protein n=1 Tax=Sedimentibacter sp. TaxID=1960295 RepID=UPI00315819E4